MSEGTSAQITHLLKESHSGDPKAAAELLPLVYEQLRSLARARMKQLSDGATLQPTALVHEAYLRVVGNDDPGWNSRGHFFAAAALAMRRILVDQYRRKKRQRRGGDRQREELDDKLLAVDAPGDDLQAIDEALKELEARDNRKGDIVNLRYFVGLTVNETAKALNISVSTVEREWRFCRRWLFQRLNNESETATD